MNYQMIFFSLFFLNFVVFVSWLWSVWKNNYWLLNYLFNKREYIMKNFIGMDYWLLIEAIADKHSISSFQIFFSFIFYWFFNKIVYILTIYKRKWQYNSLIGEVANKIKTRWIIYVCLLIIVKIIENRDIV